MFAHVHNGLQPPYCMLSLLDRLFDVSTSSLIIKRCSVLTFSIQIGARHGQILLEKGFTIPLKFLNPEGFVSTSGKTAITRHLEVRVRETNATILVVRFPPKVRRSQSGPYDLLCFCTFGTIYYRLLIIIEAVPSEPIGSTELVWCIVAGAILERPVINALADYGQRQPSIPEKLFVISDTVFQEIMWVQ